HTASDGKLLVATAALGRSDRGEATISSLSASPRCPVIPGVMYICAEHCVDDSDCSPDEKCCYDGCGHICLSHEISKICTSLHFLLQVDSSCPNELKYSPTTGGFSCVMPVFFLSVPDVRTSFSYILPRIHQYVPSRGLGWNCQP
uniref:WAP domain-containing protein n=1 Tax=Nothobranchius furzeri TaxID=105023 RepID=A0A8C6LV48_NOTFU